jgi:hypothetical protein
VAKVAATDADRIASRNVTKSTTASTSTSTASDELIRRIWGKDTEGGISTKAGENGNSAVNSFDEQMKLKMLEVQLLYIIRHNLSFILYYSYFNF